MHESDENTVTIDDNRMMGAMMMIAVLVMGVKSLVTRMVVVIVVMRISL